MAGGWWPTRLERRIAARYLRGQRGTRRAALQTVVAIGGIAVGVMALIVVMGIMNGLRDDLRDRILVAAPHLRVLPWGEALRIEDWETVIETVRSQDGVIAAAPEVLTGTIARNSSGHVELAKVAGFEPGVGTNQITRFDSTIVTGEFGPEPVRSATDSVQANVVLGFRLAQRLSAEPGDLIQIVSPMSARPSRITGEVTPIVWVVQVTGTFETGMYVYDNEFVVMDRTVAQQFAGLGSAVSAIAVHVANPDAAPSVALGIETVLGYPYRTQTWQQQNEQLFSALELEKLGMGLVIFFIMIVASFNIVGTLTMVVAFKTREIGILQAMGLSSRSIARIFVTQGAIVGLIGTGLGLLLGVGTALIVDRSGLVRIDPSIYFLDHLPIHLDPIDVAVVTIAAVMLAVVATIHPARQAAALAPVDAVRAE